MAFSNIDNREHTMEYTLNTTTFKAVYGDITDYAADAIAIPTTPSLMMDCGISCKVKAKGGQAVEDEARAAARGLPGAAVATGGCSLPARHVFHCVMLDEDRQADQELLRSSVRSSLEQAAALGLKTLAFPAIGASFSGLSPKTATQIIFDETRKAVEEGMPFSCITFIVCDPAPFTYFKKTLKLWFKKSAGKKA